MLPFALLDVIRQCLTLINYFLDDFAGKIHSINDLYWPDIKMVFSVKFLLNYILKLLPQLSHHPLAKLITHEWQVWVDRAILRQNLLLGISIKYCLQYSVWLNFLKISYFSLVYLLQKLVQILLIILSTWKIIDFDSKIRWTFQIVINKLILVEAVIFEKAWEQNPNDHSSQTHPIQYIQHIVSIN